ncbi:uncharacterized protein [Typha latifolia]|uniref:uncharacterized protein isoform X1 n=1 Tax=Typha latifolia TaxID=4733 RepID=UPI003C2DDD01
MEIAARSVTEQLMHKNRLQEYTQRSCIPMPIYQTVNEGHPHAPKFRSTVLVDGETFQSPRTFAHRKEAEQDVAKLALEAISRKTMDKSILQILQDTTFCKSILNEHAVKVNISKPTYSTSQSEGLLPIFVSSVTFDGKTYMGDAGRNKKEAEQRAARVVIKSILESSNTRTVMSQIIKSKERLYLATHTNSVSTTLESRNLALDVPVGNEASSFPVKAVQDTQETAELPCVALQSLPAQLAGMQTVSSEPKKSEEECSGDHNIQATVDMPLPNLAQGNLIAATFQSSDEFCHAQKDQVKDVAVLVGPSIQPVSSSNSKKRSKKKQKGASQLKQARTDVPVLSALPVINPLHGQDMLLEQS